MARHLRDIAAEFHGLTKGIKQAQARREELRKELIARTDIGDTELGTYKIIHQHKDRTSFDSLALEQLVTEKGLWDLCKKKVVDPDLVEQCYYEGRLTDADLREVRDPKYSDAIKVERIDDDLQVETDSMGEQPGA